MVVLRGFERCLPGDDIFEGGEPGWTVLALRSSPIEETYILDSPREGCCGKQVFQNLEADLLLLYPHFSGERIDGGKQLCPYEFRLDEDIGA